MTQPPYTLSLDLEDFRQHKVGSAMRETEPLNEGEVLFRVDKLALTANSISYGFAGKSGLIRYLDIFPADEGYANLPCWGYADVVSSKHPSLSVGDRVYGLRLYRSKYALQWRHRHLNPYHLARYSLRSSVSSCPPPVL